MFNKYYNNLGYYYNFIDPWSHYYTNQVQYVALSAWVLFNSPNLTLNNEYVILRQKRS